MHADGCGSMVKRHLRAIFLQRIFSSEDGVTVNEDRNLQIGNIL